MSKQPSLQIYRDTIEAMTRTNIRAIMADSRYSEAERLGTAIIALTAIIGGTAGPWAAHHPHLHNAPLEAVIRDMLGLLTETLCQTKKPDLKVVQDAGASE